MPGRYSVSGPPDPSEDLEEEINGKKEDEDEDDPDRDDEPTQVTKLYEAYRECALDTRKSLKKAAREARKVQQLARKRPSSTKLKAVLSTPPPPPPESDKK
jgi:hypothetical protein